MKNKAQSVTFGAVLVFLLCYFMQLLNFPNVVTVLAGAALCMLLAVKQKCLRIDPGLCLLTLTMVSYYVIVNGVRGLMFTVLYIPVILYVLGNYSACSLQETQNREKGWFLLIGALAAGYAVHGILNSYMYYAGYVIPGTRQWQDFWSRAIVPGTQHTAYFLPVLALFFPAVAYFKERKWLNAVLIIGTIFFGYTSLATRSRMSVVIFAMVVCVQAVLYILTEREKVRKMLSGKVFWAAAAVFVIALIAGAFLVKDSAVIVAFVENLGKGGGILHNVRFEAQRLALEQLFRYPMGGRLMELGRTYCHNTWLDMANAGGIIPFFAFAAYTVYTFYELVRFLMKKTIAPKTRLIAAGFYAAFFLYLSVEPALDASIHLVTPWIFTNGLIHGRLTQEKR